MLTNSKYTSQYKWNIGGAYKTHLCLHQCSVNLFWGDDQNVLLNITFGSNWLDSEWLLAVGIGSYQTLYSGYDYSVGKFSNDTTVFFIFILFCTLTPLLSEWCIRLFRVKYCLQWKLNFWVWIEFEYPNASVHL